MVRVFYFSMSWSFSYDGGASLWLVSLGGGCCWA